MGEMAAAAAALASAFDTFLFPPPMAQVELNRVYAILLHRQGRVGEARAALQRAAECARAAGDQVALKEVRGMPLAARVASV